MLTSKLGGNWDLRVGIKETKASINNETEAILSCKSTPWKNIAKLIMLNNNRGKKIVERANPGSLYMGIAKFSTLKTDTA
jgi:hypothetical protein